MTPLPSSLQCISFLRYSVRGNSETSALSRSVRTAIKNDGSLTLPGHGPIRGIEFTAQRLREELANHSFLTEYFGPNVTLVPAPRSGILQPDALWPAKRICDALVAEGLAGNILPLLVRNVAVQKAATAPPGGRPGPEQHYETVSVDTQQLLHCLEAVTLVDDIVTRGSSLLGLSARLAEHMPNIPVRSFAVIRTISHGDVATILDPVKCLVTYTHGRLERIP